MAKTKISNASREYALSRDDGTNLERLWTPILIELLLKFRVKWFGEMDALVAVLNVCAVSFVDLKKVDMEESGWGGYIERKEVEEGTVEQGTKVVLLWPAIFVDFEASMDGNIWPR